MPPCLLCQLEDKKDKKDNIYFLMSILVNDMAINS